MPHVVVIANPSSRLLREVGVEALASEVATQLESRGWDAADLLETHARDGGVGVARDAVAAGADLVLVAGGDSTVRAVAETLAGTGLPVGILPTGSGNLLARNLGVPLDVPSALATALDGDDVALDLGRLDDGAGTFAVMAGIGADAAVLRATPDSPRARRGWPAYVLAGAATIRRRRFDVEISLDGQPAMRRRALSVLVGNVGRLQSDLPASAEAAADDGVLDVCLLTPRTRRARLLALWREVLRRPPLDEDDRWERWQARSVLVRAAERQPRRLDGEPIADSSALDASVVPGAVLVRVPAGNGPQHHDIVDLGQTATEPFPEPAGALRGILDA